MIEGVYLLNFNMLKCCNVENGEHFENVEHFEMFDNFETHTASASASFDASGGEELIFIFVVYCIL